MTESMNTSDEQPACFPDTFKIEFYKSLVNKIQKQEEIIVHTNSFYLTLTTAIASIVLFVANRESTYWQISSLGLFVSCLWLVQIIALRYRRGASYKTLEVIEGELGLKRELLSARTQEPKSRITSLTLWRNELLAPGLICLIWGVLLISLLLRWLMNCSSIDARAFL